MHKLPSAEMFQIDQETLEESEDMTEYVDHLTNRFVKYQNRRKTSKWHSVKIQKDEPIAIVWMGDPHIDDNGCDWVTLRRDIDIIKDLNYVLNIIKDYILKIEMDSKNVKLNQ